MTDAEGFLGLIPNPPSLPNTLSLGPTHSRSLTLHHSSFFLPLTAHSHPFTRTLSSHSSLTLSRNWLQMRLFPSYSPCESKPPPRMGFHPLANRGYFSRWWFPYARWPFVRSGVLFLVQGDPELQSGCFLAILVHLRLDP